MDENDGPSLENLSQIPQPVPAVTPQPQIVHDAIKPVKCEASNSPETHLQHIQTFQETESYTP